MKTTAVLTRSLSDHRAFQRRSRSGQQRRSSPIRSSTSTASGRRCAPQRHQLPLGFRAFNHCHAGFNQCPASLLVRRMQGARAPCSRCLWARCVHDRRESASVRERCCMIWARPALAQSEAQSGATTDGNCAISKRSVHVRKMNMSAYDENKLCMTAGTQAEKCGIACVVPPPSFMPPFALDKGTNGVSADSFRFAIRKQLTSHLCMRLANAPKARAGLSAGHQCGDHTHSRRNSGRLARRPLSPDMCCILRFPVGSGF